MNDCTFLSHSPVETQNLGNVLGRIVQPGTVISLVGDLGAGKTTLTAAIARGLGIDPEKVSSPTFMLIQEYAGRIPLYHFDTYRLKDLHEFEDLGVEEYFYGEGVCLVEWGDRFREVMPVDLLRIEISIQGESERRFDFSANGSISQLLVKQLLESELEGLT